MKYLFHFVAAMLFGWPLLIAGYVYRSAQLGFQAGAFLHDRHEEAALKAFGDGA